MGVVAGRHGRRDHGHHAGVVAQWARADAQLNGASEDGKTFPETFQWPTGLPNCLTTDNQPLTLYCWGGWALDIPGWGSLGFTYYRI